MNNDETKKDSIRNEMLTKPINKLVIKMAVPTTIIQIISVVYNTADTYFVSHIDKSAAAAVGVGFSLMSIIQAVGFGFGMGAGSLISRELGAKEVNKAYKNANSALAAVFVLSIIISIVGLLNLEPVMRLLGSSSTMLSYSCDYGKYILMGCPIMCMALVLNVILRSEGSAKYAMFGIITGGVLNMFLDPVLIYTFDFGIAGAAIATIISQFISMVILLIPFLLHKSIVRLNIKYISHSVPDYIKIITTGSPTFCRQGLASFASALLNRKARLYGDAAIAAVTIANKIYLLIRNIILGIGQGFQPVAGYNYGAGKKKRTKDAFIFSCIIGTIISTLSAVIIFLNAEMIISWFQNDADVVSYGKTALYFACMAMPFMVYSTFVDQIYQCLGFSKIAALLACSRQGIMFIPLILILPAFYKFTGVQIAQPLADILSFFMCIPFQIWFFKKILNTKSSDIT